MSIVVSATSQWWWQGSPYTGITEYPQEALDTSYDSGRVVLESNETDIRGILRAGGLLPVTDYHVYTENYEVTHVQIHGDYHDPNYPDTSWYNTWSGSCDTFTGFTPPSATPPDVDWSGLKQEAFAKSNSAAIDVLTNVAELPESVRMMKDFFRNLRSRVTRIANIRHVRASRGFEEFVSVFSDAWLEYRYGWRPLVGSFNDLIDAVNTIGSDTPNVVVSGRGIQRDVVSNADPVFSSPMNLFGGYVDTHSTRVDFESRMFVSQLIAKFHAAFGFSPITAWELVPYSFVVDSFTSIGNAIAANWKPPGVVAITAGRSIKAVTEASTLRERPSEPYSLTWTPGQAIYRKEEYQRWSEEPMPPTPQLVSRADRLSLATWLDYVLLANGLLKSVFNGR